MKKIIFRISFPIYLIVFSLILNSGLSAQSSQEIMTPDKYFGFKPGTDSMLFTYEELISYLEKLDAASERVKLVEIGKSPQGRKMYIAFISSPENIGNLERLKELNRRLALDPDILDMERESIIDKGKVFFLATLSMHSDEVGPSQAAPLIAYELATTQDPLKLKWMEDVVYMMVPCHNPDGMDMIINHYKKYKDTKYEGSSMPGVYHKYIGHDNNRDFIILSQEDTKAIAAIYNLEWFPQIMVEKHQMGSRGPRYFVPPSHDPIAENVDEGIWNWAGIFGMNMIKDMTKEGLAGISQHYIFDDYWPGSTETCIWKNVIGFLTEAASAQYASPIFIEPNELAVGGKGLSEYKKSVNMPLLWEGGWWKLSDIVDYEIVSTMSILKTASLHRKDILQFRNDLCRKEVNKGKSIPPFYYILPLRQHDRSELVSLVNLMKEHGVDAYQLTKQITIEGRIFNEGDIVFPLSQPFRPFIKEVLELQEYPVRHYTPDGEIIKPYDITSWSLPLHKGLTSFEIKTRPENLDSSLDLITGDFTLQTKIPDTFKSALFSVNNNESFLMTFLAKKTGLKVVRTLENFNYNNTEIPKGSFIIPFSSKIGELIAKLKVAPEYITDDSKIASEPFKLPRIALVETIFHDMDAGWTRFIFDTYNLPYKIVKPGDFEKTDFGEEFDVVVFPDADKSILMEGKSKRGDDYYISDYPPEFTKGIGKKGLEKLMTFLDNGGTIVSWGRSTNLFLGALEINRGKEDKEEFQLPVQDISENLQKSGFYSAGSLMKLLITKDHPVTQGVQNEIGVFFRGRPVYATSIPNFDMGRRVLGKFPEKDILMSGYAEKEEKIGDKSALVWLKKGKGQLVLFAFNPQFRASTPVSYKLLFNAILLPKL